MLNLANNYFVIYLLERRFKYIFVTDNKIFIFFRFLCFTIVGKILEDRLILEFLFFLFF